MIFFLSNIPSLKILNIGAGLISPYEDGLQAHSTPTILLNLFVHKAEKADAWYIHLFLLKIFENDASDK